MKKFLLLVTLLIGLYTAVDFTYYYSQLPFSFNPSDTITTFTGTTSDNILLDQGSGLEPFEIRGINMGLGIPGVFPSDYAIDKETYLRWFKLIQELGINTLRVYTIHDASFYEAFYEFNVDNPDPLYLLHGVWIDEYTLNSHRTAFDPSLIDVFMEDTKTLVDIIHGRKKIFNFNNIGSQTYTCDISEWTLGYIIGIEWEDTTVIFTDKQLEDISPFEGDYLYTDSDATPFESFLAQVGDSMIAYETSKYHTQRLLAFSNWPTTDPFTYPEIIKLYFRKVAQVDVENILVKPSFKAGQFVSYHVYPYYPDYLAYLGQEDSYFTYLEALSTYHTMPVVISEYGVPSSRGMAQRELNGWRSQGKLSETQQGEALISMYEDIMASGAVGSCLFTWQDEWFKRTWNTMAHTDLNHTPFWSDYQTNEQYFGLLSFDPGETESIVYVDGILDDWDTTSPIYTSNSLNLSLQYDEKFIYLLVEKEDYNPSEDILYLPFDTTPKSGSLAVADSTLQFDRPTDFLLVLKGKEESRLLVQERYDTYHALNGHLIDEISPYFNPPSKDSPIFVPINLLLQTQLAAPLDPNKDPLKQTLAITVDTYETGLLTHGNANPKFEDFNSLADFYINGDFIEIKLPWGLLNFSNPSMMTIHDDYYTHYGVENLSIDTLHVGIGNADEPISLVPVELKKWHHHITYHERLKSSYYILQDYWRTH